ncbi:hypothetical protein [Streptomyces hiroshimensis]
MTSAELALRAYDVDPLFRWFQRRRLPPRLLLLSLPVQLVPLVACSGFDGNLTLPGFPDVARADFRRLVRLGAGSPDFSVPLVRDYPSLINVVIAAFTLLLAFENCRRIADFPSGLHARGLILVPPHSRTTVRIAVMRANRWFAACGRHSWAVALVSLAVGGLLSGAYREGGVFLWLAPGTDDEARREWSMRAYASWWASPEAGGLTGPVAYVLVASGIAYVIIKHNFMGLCMMSFFFAIRKDVAYVFDTANPDGCHGWKAMRDLLHGVVVSLLISLVGFCSLFLSLSVRQVSWTAPFLLLFLLCVPVFLLVPLVLLRSGTKRYREQEIARLQDCFAELRQRASPGSLEQFEIARVERREIAVIRDGRVRLFRVKEVVATLSIYVGSVVTTLIGILDR